MLTLFDCIRHSSSISPLEEIKLIVIVNWIFHVWNVLRSFMIYFKYGLTLLRHSSTDSVLFPSPLFSYSKWLMLQKLPTLIGL